MKIEELMSQLKEKYTVVIVTHNMQQAARISDRTAFSCWVKWWSRAPRPRSSAPRRTSVPRTTSPAASADRHFTGKGLLQIMSSRT